MFRRSLATLCSSLGKMDRYDPKQGRSRVNRKIVCKKRSQVASRWQFMLEYFQPSTSPGNYFFDHLELGKTAMMFMFPILMLLYWKNCQESLPVQWEKDCQGLQNRQFKEENTSSDSVDYFSIIDDFQKRQKNALEKKAKDLQKM